MTAVFSSSWRVSWLWPQNFLTSVLSSIHSDDHAGSLAAPSKNSWKWQSLCGCSHLLLVLRVIREQDSAGCDTLLPQLVWDGESSISLPLFGRQEMDFPAGSGSGEEDETTMSMVVGGCQPHLWMGEGRVKEGTKNQETTFIPKVALRLKSAGQTWSPTRQQNSISRGRDRSENCLPRSTNLHQHWLQEQHSSPALNLLTNQATFVCYIQDSWTPTF